MMPFPPPASALTSCKICGHPMENWGTIMPVCSICRDNKMLRDEKTAHQLNMEIAQRQQLAAMANSQYQQNLSAAQGQWNTGYYSQRALFGDIEPPLPPVPKKAWGPIIEKFFMDLLRPLWSKKTDV